MPTISLLLASTVHPVQRHPRMPGLHSVWLAEVKHWPANQAWLPAEQAMLRALCQESGYALDI